MGVFEENARLLQWLVFFVSSTRSVHFLVHLFNIINLNYGPPKHTRNSRTSSKKHSDFLRHNATFLKFFGFHQRVSPSFVSIFCNTMDLEKPKGPPFTILSLGYSANLAVPGLFSSRQTRTDEIFVQFVQLNEYLGNASKLLQRVPSFNFYFINVIYKTGRD